MDFLAKSLKNIKSGLGLKDNSMEYFKFHDQFPVEGLLNGLCFNDVYVPLEVVSHILSFLEADELLSTCSLVFYNRREYPRRAAHLPWYVFYCYFATDNFKNLLKNGNGQERFDHWQIVENGGHHFKIEDLPEYADPLPLDTPEFYGHTSCFSTSYNLCFKIQEISLMKKRLLRYILFKYKPILYVSEWWAARYDCGCLYQLSIRCCSEYDRIKFHEERRIPYAFRNDNEAQPPNLPYTYVTKRESAQQWERMHWSKVEIEVRDYRADIAKIVFGHEGRDTMFWKGHYGSKMAGGVVKFLFESIKEDIIY
ncbi:F-box only protein 6-like isoform X2 [Cylas formicarius]|uniref:F-box only protein 6-like isoform X2 n=1 Tax=Cylas formicarius TaxID=197179 RepID=UPI002958D31A|nr:F-box only protein 6-like isoform X2 [Cylas formicarius]